MLLTTVAELYTTVLSDMNAHPLLAKVKPVECTVLATHSGYHVLTLVFGALVYGGSHPGKLHKLSLTQ